MRRFVLVLLLFALPATAKPLVLTTIRPLTMIVAAVAGDAVAVRQLLPDGDSPHHWALKMSDRRLLDRADLVLWIGPDMETALVNGVAMRRGDGVITAVDLPQIQWPPPMPTEREGVRDAHIWLSPANAAIIAREVAGWLVRAHPEGRDMVRAREQAFIDSMARTQVSVDARLAPVRDQKFVVDHDGLRHFVAAFGLHQAGYFTDAGDRDIGAREMDRLLAQTDIRCLVVGPGPTDQMRQMARRLEARLAVVDPYGAADVAPAPDAYGRFLAGIGEQLAECLGARPGAKTLP